MERRKLQKVGHSTLSVSLPKEWITLTGVNRGDIVYLDQTEDGALRIVSEDLLEKEREPTEYEINCDLISEKKLLERLIVGCYVQGVDMIKVFSSTRIESEHREEVRTISRRLIGLSIMEESRQEIILQCSIDPYKVEIYLLLQRLSVIASTMLNEAMEALHEFNTDFADDVIIREGEANNIFWLITRLIFMAHKSQTLTKRIAVNTPLSLTGIRLVSRSLERIADCAENLAKIALHIQQIKETMTEKEVNRTSSLDKKTKEIYRKAVNSLFLGNVRAANEALNLRDELEAEVADQMQNSTILYFRTIAIMLAMIAENSATIAFEAINLEIKRTNCYQNNKYQEESLKR